jgi:hypothetical protein
MKENGAQRRGVARKASAKASHSLYAGVNNKWKPSHSPLLVANRVHPIEHLSEEAVPGTTTAMLISGHHRPIAVRPPLLGHLLTDGVVRNLDTIDTSNAVPESKTNGRLKCQMPSAEPNPSQ